LELVDVEPTKLVVGLQTTEVVVKPVLADELQQVLDVRQGKRRPVADSTLSFSLVNLEAD